MCIGIALLFAISLMSTASSAQQARKVLSNPSPEYPEIAKRMSLSGVVKIEVTIGTDGQVKFTKVLGGHPLLVDSALKALKKWKFVSNSSETTEVLEFRF